MRVLIYGFSAEDAARVVKWLKAAGHEVDLSSHPFDALDLISKGKSESILVASAATLMDGRTFSRAVRLHPAFAGLRTILVEFGNTNIPDPISLEKYGVSAILRTPFGRDDLLRTIGGAPLAPAPC